MDSGTASFSSFGGTAAPSTQSTTLTLLTNPNNDF